MKNRKMIFFLLLLSFLMPGHIFSEKMILNNSIGDRTIDLVKKDRELKMNDLRMKIFFDAIRKHNNKYVKYHLATRENIERNKNDENMKVKNSEGIYGPEYADITGGYYVNDPKFALIDVNSSDQTGYTPIIVAIEAKNDEILKLLIENGANLHEKHPIFGKLTLHTACYYESEGAVEILLNADRTMVNAKSGKDGWLPLQDATLKSNSRIVRMLLEYGADPRLTDNKGGTPMDMATEFGKGEIVKLLRDNIKKNRK